MLSLAGIGILNHSYYEFLPHEHPTWELTYYLSGTGIAIVGDTELPFKERDIIVKPPGISHSERSREGFRNIFLWFSGLQTIRSPIMMLHDFETNCVEAVLTQLHMEYQSHRSYHQEIIASLLEVVHQCILTSACERRKDPRIESFESLLITNISNLHFDIGKALAGVALCPDHFKKLFKNATGLTPNQYLTEKRINQAKHLLEAGYSEYGGIKRVAEMVGFEDSLYFSRVFQKIVGQCPKTWIGSARST